MFIKNRGAAWSLVVLAYVGQLLTPSIAHAVEPENSNALEVPINLVSLSEHGERLQLWIEGDRLDGCDLSLELMQHAEEIEERLIEIRIQVFHTLPVDSDCVGEFVPFVLPFNVQQPLERGYTYQFWVNDYQFTVENQDSDAL